MIRNLCTAASLPLKLKLFMFMEITLLYAYFYYQGALYRMNGNILPSCKDSIQSYIYRLIKTFNISKNDMISLIYASPAEYMEKKQYSFMGVGPYIESESFGDFLLRI